MLLFHFSFLLPKSAAARTKLFGCNAQIIEKKQQKIILTLAEQAV
jgi:hypothetical protein